MTYEITVDPDCERCGGEGVDADPYGRFDYDCRKPCPCCWKDGRHDNAPVVGGTTNMDDLIARLQAAAADDQRELLLEAWALINGPRPGLWDEGFSEHIERWSVFVTLLDVEAYESAAITLFDGDDWEWSLEREHTEHLWSGSDWTHRAKFGDPLLGYEGEAATPALAIVIAALRAKAKT